MKTNDQWKRNYNAAPLRKIIFSVIEMEDMVL